MKALLAVLLLSPSLALAAPGELSAGSASFKQGDKVTKLAVVAAGSIQKTGDIVLLDLQLKDAKGTSDNVAEKAGSIFRIKFGAAKPGKVRAVGMLVAKSAAGISVKKGDAKCAVEVKVLTEKQVEGTASCTGMVDLDDKPAPDLAEVTFSATAG